jgi:hypothetical protein
MQKHHAVNAEDHAVRPARADNESASVIDLEAARQARRRPAHVVPAGGIVVYADQLDVEALRETTRATARSAARAATIRRVR